MLGKKRYAPKMFYSVQMEEFVPSDHELRRIAKVVDFSFVRSKVKELYSHTGQPSVDPEVIVKLLFLGYYYGILKERQLVKRVQTDLAFRWFLGYDFDESVPTHSVLSKARKRYGVDIFQTIFEQIVDQCIKAGLVGGEQAFMDATLIEANASIKSLQPRLRVLSPSAYTEEIFKETEDSNESAPPSDPAKKGTSFNEKMVSKTDPEATFRRGHSKKSGLYYEGHYLIDRKARVIVAAIATDTVEAADKQARPLLMQARFRHGLRFKSFCADSEYGTQGLYQFLFSEGIRPYIPPQGPKAKPGPFSKDQFSYDAEQDVYHCPEGHRLKRGVYEAAKKRYRYRHEIPGTCRSCPSRSQCVSGNGDRQVRRLLYQDAVDRARQIVQDFAYKKQMRLRRCLIEPLFGEAKQGHGLERALSRGLDNMMIQVLLTAVALNIKRLLQQAGKKMGHGLNALTSFVCKTPEAIKQFLTSLLNCQRTFAEAWF